MSSPRIHYPALTLRDVEIILDRGGAGISPGEKLDEGEGIQRQQRYPIRAAESHLKAGASSSGGRKLAGEVTLALKRRATSEGATR